jgi:hypothetical protein
MKLGLVGLPMSGKTTVFNALTGASRPTSVSAPGKLDVQMAVVDVPDPRLDALEHVLQAARKVYAKITYADIGGLTKGISEGGLSGPFRNQLSQLDGFLHVIRVFEDPNVPHPEETIDPQRDLEILDAEFLLSDLVTIETRIKRLHEEIDRGKDRAANLKELELFERLRAALEAERPLRDLEFKPEEQFALRGYGFLSQKPKLVLLNVGDEAHDPAQLVRVGGRSTGVEAIQGRLEAEIAQLAPEEAALFLQEYGITEPMRDRVIRESYRLLHIQTFFTGSEQEVRAWPCPVGATAQEAAGEIHTDLQRGFIRAEIIPWDVLVELGGLAEARHAGKLRLEGKDYIMQEGDMMTVRFNV